MTVREAVKEDLAKLLLLYQHLHNEEMPESATDLERIWEKILENPLLVYFVVEIDGLIVSSCNLAITSNLTRKGRPVGLIENVVTHADYRNRGLGKNVIQSAISYARRENCYKVMLLSGSDRKEAHKLYESLGFDSAKKVGFVLKFD